MRPVFVRHVRSLVRPASAFHLASYIILVRSLVRRGGQERGLNHAAEIVGGGVDVIDVGFGWSSFCFLMDVEKGGGGSSRGQSRFL